MDGLVILVVIGVPVLLFFREVEDASRRARFLRRAGMILMTTSLASPPVCRPDTASQQR
jgi:hypothetical protein